MAGRAPRRGGPLESRGRWLEARVPGLEGVCFYRGGGRPLLCAWASPAIESSGAGSDVFDYVRVEPGGRVYAKADASRLAGRLPSGRLEAVAWSAGRPAYICDVRVERGGVVVEGCREREGPAPGCHTPDPLAWPLTCRTTPGDLEALAALLGPSPPGGSPARLAWRVLEWMDQNLDYDHARAASSDPRAMEPARLARLRRGVCRDYAVFAAAALLALGAREALMALLRLRGGVSHAVALARAGRPLFVLDQRLPPMEWGDYVEYALAGEEPGYTALYRVTRTEGGLAVEAFHNAKLGPRDTYPSDEPPPTLARDARRRLARAGVEVDPQLAGVAELLGLGASIALHAPTLQETPAARGTAPLTRLYHPALHEEWASLIARKALNLLEAHFPGRRRAWMTLTRQDGGDIVRVYAVPQSAPRIKASRSRDAITIRAACSTSTCDNITIAVLDANGKVIAAVAPPDITYIGVHTVTAERWIEEGGKLEVAINAATLPEGILTVIHDGEPVFAARHAKHAPRHGVS